MVWRVLLNAKWDFSDFDIGWVLVYWKADPSRALILNSQDRRIGDAELWAGTHQPPCIKQFLYLHGVIGSCTLNWQRIL